MLTTSSTLAQNNYGKSGIRLVKVVRRRDRHEVKDVTIAIALEGDFADAYVAGDNSRVLPTDTMKNTAYALAHERLQDAIERFGLELAAHFLEAQPAASRATVELREHPWRRIVVREKPYGHAFMRPPGGETRIAIVTRTRAAASVTAGLEDLLILKTANSGFWGFPRDRYTTLKETRDRLLATNLRARWTYADPDAAFEALWRSVRRTLLETFADHNSQSVQHTLYAMGDAVIQEHAEVEEIRLSMPNKHHLVVDLAPFGQDNRNEIFAATEEPFGLIEATIRRRP